MIKDFWITNISKKDIRLVDLNLTIRSYTTINLLDKKHYSVTLEQINKSLESGSLKDRKKFIVVREKSPDIVKNNIKIDINSAIPNRQRSIMEIRDEKYEELNIFDDNFEEEPETLPKKNLQKGDKNG